MEATRLPPDCRGLRSTELPSNSHRMCQRMPNRCFPVVEVHTVHKI